MWESPNLNHLRGALVGLTVGDALGATVEFLSAEEITSHGYDVGKMTASHVRHLPAGAWTDDTSMALCLADSLLECGGYDSWDVMAKYLQWQYEGYRSSVGYCFDIGGQVDRALVRFDQKDPVIKKGEPREWSAGNGAIMRLAPVVIAAANHQTIEQVMRLAQVSARETHYSEEAEAGAELFAAMLYRALRLKDKNEIVDVAQFATYSKYSAVYNDILKRVMATSQRHHEKQLRNLGGYIVDALKIAVWGFLNHDDFRDGAVAVIKLGHDTDTNAAIYGQLAGAYYGYDAIPKDWRDKTIREPEIKELADKLAAMKSCPILDTRFEEDELRTDFAG